MTARRPDPDALLRRVQADSDRARRGQLKVFLGASPGVGKTFTMLESLRAQRAEGFDVVVGVVETHGRAETARLLEGLEVLPRKSLDYRGTPSAGRTSRSCSPPASMSIRPSTSSTSRA